jgi:hypothetical protein
VVLGRGWLAGSGFVWVVVGTDQANISSRRGIQRLGEGLAAFDPAWSKGGDAMPKAP